MQKENLEMYQKIKINLTPNILKEKNLMDQENINQQSLSRKSVSKQIKKLQKFVQENNVDVELENI